MPGMEKVDRPSRLAIPALVAWAVVFTAAGAGLVLSGRVAVGVVLVVLGVVPSVALVGAAVAVTCVAFDGMERFLGDFATGEEDLETLAHAMRVGHARYPAEQLDRLMANFYEQTPVTNAWFDEHRVDFRQVEITSEDGYGLVGHAAVLAPDSHDWYVFCHGLGGGWKNGLRHARRFAGRGYNLLLVEQRAQGASGGPVIGGGHLERRDAVLWCRWICEQDACARIVLTGESLGGATVLEAAGESDLPSQVACVISDSGYADFWNASACLLSREVLGHKVSLAHPLLDLVRVFFRARRGGYDLADCSAVSAVARSRVPILLIQGGADDLIVPQNAYRLDAACSSEHELLVVEWGGHCSSVVMDPVTYYERVMRFVDAHR